MNKENVKELIIDMNIVEKMKEFGFLAAQLRACGIVLVANEEAVLKRNRDK